MTTATGVQSAVTMSAVIEQSLRHGERGHDRQTANAASSARPRAQTPVCRWVVGRDVHCVWGPEWQ
jgi:hypothetical protein